MIGTISYTTNSGLGLLAKDFYDHGIVQRILAIPHPHYEEHPNWYRSEDYFTNATKNHFLRGLKTILLFENAFRCWDLIRYVKHHGIRVVMMPMYEYTPFPLPVPADLYLCPSLLDLQYYQHLPSKFIPVPVSVPWRLRKRAEVFIHNAGHGGKNFRNGTPELIEAMRYVKSPIRLMIRAQPGEQRIQQLSISYRKDPRITFTVGEVPKHELWFTGDVFIFPERFNGLSLPLQEAYASGMLVMTSSRFPNTTWLPNEPLIPVQSYCDSFSGDFPRATHYQVANIDPKCIAETIDSWYNKDITSYSIQGNEWAKQHSWEKLAPAYLQALQG